MDDGGGQLQSSHEEGILREKAKAARENFIAQHWSCTAVTRRVTDIEAALEACELSTKEDENKLNNLRQQRSVSGEEKNALLRETRKQRAAVSSNRDLIERLQGELRELERQRRTGWRSHGGVAASPSVSWSCPCCTLDNPPTATRCGVCEEPKPVHQIPNVWSGGRVVCD